MPDTVGVQDAAFSFSAGFGLNSSLVFSEDVFQEQTKCIA